MASFFCPPLATVCLNLMRTLRGEPQVPRPAGVGGGIFRAFQLDFRVIVGHERENTVKAGVGYAPGPSHGVVKRAGALGLDVEPEVVDGVGRRASVAQRGEVGIFRRNDTGLSRMCVRAACQQQELFL